MLSTSRLFSHNPLVGCVINKTEAKTLLTKHKEIVERQMRARVPPLPVDHRTLFQKEICRMSITYMIFINLKDNFATQKSYISFNMNQTHEQNLVEMVHIHLANGTNFI